MKNEKSILQTSFKILYNFLHGALYKNIMDMTGGDKA